MLFEGIVEKDDVDYGIVKVRIFGKHTHDVSILSTDDLPDAKIIYSGESNIDEISYFRTITNGTHVICAFLDKDEQYPVILGSVVKTVENLPDFTTGFSDPNLEHPDLSHLTESTISRLARNENIPLTIQQTKTLDLETGISCVSETFFQPSNNFSPEYPNNRVLQTKKHIIEIDDTDGHERINIYHNSGSFTEFNPDGSLTEKVKDNKFLSVEEDLNIVVHGTCNIKSDSDINIEGTNINLNGDADNLIAYADMLIAFNTLKAELNALITIFNSNVTLYNSHTHGDPAATPTPTSTSLGSPGVVSIADMSSSIISTIKVP